MAYFKTCPDCGAHLDPGERCGCNKEAPRLLQQSGAQDGQKRKPANGSIANLPPAGKPERTILATIYQRSICDMVNEMDNADTLREVYALIEKYQNWKENAKHA